MRIDFGKGKKLFLQSPPKRLLLGLFDPPLEVITKRLWPWPALEGKGPRVSACDAPTLNLHGKLH